MFEKRERLWQALLPLGVLVAIVLGVIILNTASTYAAEGNSLYDTVPVFVDGSEGETVHPIKITAGEGNKERTMYLVKLPENTAKVKFYDSSEDQNQYFNHPKSQTCAAFNTTFPKTDYYDDGWWIIDVSDLAFKQRTVWYNNLKVIEEHYVKEAEYYELIPEAGNTKDTKAHLFIQIGDSDHPLDVYATGDGVRGDYFNEDTRIELALNLTNNRDGVISDSKQDIYYTTDNTDPVSSETAIKYTEPFTIEKSCTVQAAPKVTDDKWGETIQVQCVINLSMPSFSPAEGCYFGEQKVAISSDIADAEIFYSTDGTEPIPVDDEGNLVENDSIKKYESPIVVDKNQTIKAVAVKKGENAFGDEVYLVSAVASAKYTLSTGIDVRFNGEDQGVWLIGSTINTPMFGFENEGTIVTPHGHSKCSVIISADDNATLKLNDEPIQRETSGENAGKYLVDLDVSEAENTHGDDGKENVIVVENGDDSAKYSIWCISSKYDDVPDSVYDYFVPSSQYTNNGLYGVAPNRTLIGKPDFVNGSSLGNFGGYITWYYENGIINDPNNPYGVDFMVFGNSFDGTNEAAEPGNIMVSKDGENWYTLAGSIHYDNSAIWGQKVSYNNEGGFSHYKFEPDNGISEETSRFLYPDIFFYPLHGDKDAESFTTSGTFLVPEGGVNAYGNVKPPYPAFGYADVSGSRHCGNEAENPYGGIVRDETFADRVTTDRNGDACDIAWAVDDNGNPVKLDKIHYVKVQTATFIDNGAIGEKSTEVNVMRIAKAADSAVGVTAAPKSIKIDGTSVDLKPGEMVNASVNGIFDVVVDAPEDANVYINSLRSHTAFMDKAPHGIVRVIVQEGQKEPLIYYFKIDQSGTASGQKVTFDTGKGLMQDKEKLVCYFDADTIEHVGTDGVVEFPEATAPNEKQAFAGWTDESGEFVAAYSAETTGDITLTAKYAKAEDVEAAKKVTEQIEALKAKEDLTAEDADAVKAARDAYDALTDAQKELISAETLTKLTEAEAAVSAAKVDDVIKQIEEISDADKLTLEDKEKVEAAREAYDSLTEEDQAKVTNSPNLKVAEATIAKLEAEDKAAKAEDRAAAAEAKVADAEAKAAAAEAKVKEAEDKVAEAQAKLEELQKDKAADEEALAKAEKDLEKANADLKAAKAEQETTAERLEKAQKELKDAEEKAAKAEASQKEAAAAAEAAAAGAQDEIEALKAKLAIEQQKNAVLSKTVKILKPKAKKKSALIRWKKAGKGLTYVVYRSTKPTKGFKKAATSKKLKVTVKKLKKGKTYYFKVRAYKKIADKKVWTGYSKVVKVKIKK